MRRLRKPIFSEIWDVWVKPGLWTELRIFDFYKVFRLQEGDACYSYLPHRGGFTVNNGMPFDRAAAYKYRGIIVILHNMQHGRRKKVRFVNNGKGVKHCFWAYIRGFISLLFGKKEHWHRSMFFLYWCITKLFSLRAKQEHCFDLKYT